MLAGPDAYAIHLAALDYLLERPEVDSSKIAVVGASFGGHWSTKLAHAVPDKLRGAVNWGGGIHYFFQPEWQARSRHATPIFLISSKPAPISSARKLSTSFAP